MSWDWIQIRLIGAACVGGVSLLLMLALRKEKEKREAGRFASFLTYRFSVQTGYLIAQLLYGRLRWYGIVLFLLEAAVFDLLLLALLPLLRKRFDADTCASLWNLPLLSFLLGSWILSDEPFVVLHLGGTWFWMLLEVWAVGFLGVLFYHILSHLRVRRHMLAHAAPAPEWIRAVYQDTKTTLLGTVKPELVVAETTEVPAFLPLENRWAQAHAELRTYSRVRGTGYTMQWSRLQTGWVPEDEAVVCSPDVDSPVTIGLFRKTKRVVLPSQRMQEGAGSAYSPEELRLIFQHEMIHLLCHDNWTKLYLTVISAFAWFLPPVWLGLRRAAEDMELACDETVTQDMSEQSRKQYAALLLADGGSVRGITTCLSDTASGLRYRLDRILHPKKRRSDAVLLSMLGALFCLCFGLVGFTVKTHTQTIQEAVWYDTDGWDLTLVRTEQAENWSCPDAEALLNKIGEIEVTELVGAETGYDQLGRWRMRIERWDEFCDRGVEMGLYENGIHLRRKEGSRYVQSVWLYETDPDWPVIFSLLGEPTE